MKKLLFLLIVLPFLSQGQVLTQGGKVLTQGGKILTRGGSISTLPNLKIWHAARLESGTADATAKANILDYSGNGQLAAQATGANQPLYKTSGINGFPAYLFDGTNDGFSYSGLALGQNVGGLTCYVVYQKGVGTTDMVLLNISVGTGVSGRFNLYARASGVPFGASRRLDAEAATTISGGVSDTSPHILAFVVDYTNGRSTLFQDGVKVNTVALLSSGSTSNTAASQATLGLYNTSSPAQWFQGYIGEVVFCQSAHPDATVYSTMAQLKSIYGL